MQDVCCSVGRLRASCCTLPFALHRMDTAGFLLPCSSSRPEHASSTLSLHTGKETVLHQYL